uniref:Uncharacterized protein n=1 Tax=Timema poppense TaxID=170557 RepID=A0A7R9H239_TIMPO|nr:unnamed protein product [Timema poppensis]
MLWFILVLMCDAVVCSQIPTTDRDVSEPEVDSYEDLFIALKNDVTSYDDPLEPYSIEDEEISPRYVKETHVIRSLGDVPVFKSFKVTQDEYIPVKLINLENLDFSPLNMEYVN